MQSYPSPYPPFMFPSWRTESAIARGVEKNLMMRTWGGIGDQVCAEPTLRYALKSFKGCRISLASEQPELFRHLPFAEVYDLRKVQPLWERYLTFDSIRPTSDLAWEFYSHMLVNCVDYCSLSAFRSQLPIADREVMLRPTAFESQRTYDLLAATGDAVILHPGRHWQSKTFPAAWWDAVIQEILSAGATPVLIGGDTDDNRGTVAVDAAMTVDLRGKLSLLETVALLKRARVLLTNDSAPLHLAVDSDCWIGFVATCKHPDMISHWRRGRWSWRMANLGRDGIWNHVSHCPNSPVTIEVENIGDDLLAKCLPEPAAFARWGLDKLTKEGTNATD